jgi:hypothetical protein
MKIGAEQYLGGGRWQWIVLDDASNEHVIEIVGQGRKYLLSGQRSVWLSYVVRVDDEENIPQGRLWRTRADAFDAGVRYLKSIRSRGAAG